MQHLIISDFLKRPAAIPLIDVRSPAEYARGHIPGAVNIPLFDNQERHNVGVVYAELGRIPAIQKGLELVGPRLQSLAQQAQQLSLDKQRYVYCWRGGMRSEKMAWLFELSEMDCYVLHGGYKAWRHHIMDAFGMIQHPRVLHGPTGSGKTDILHALQELGQQVIDLEALAHHRGSAFGDIGLPAQPTSQQFHNTIFQQLYGLRPDNPIWFEAESRSIGLVQMPDPLYMLLKNAPLIEIIVPRPLRIERLVKDYGGFPAQELIEAVKRLQEKLGGARTREITRLIANDHLHDAVDALLDYYDKTYAYTRQRLRTATLISVETDSADARANALLLLEAIQVRQKKIRDRRKKTTDTLPI